MSAPETAAERLPPRQPDSPDRVIGKYRLLEILGRGGTGEVYRARDDVLGRDVAVKLLREPNDSEGAAKLLREARSAAQFNHPNVVTVHEVDIAGDTCCIVMEFVRGVSAAELLRRRGRLPWREATRVVADACRGLAAAHRVGLIHRDLKPSNIIVAADGVAKLADFGLARSSDNSLSAGGSLAGTPNYMSPEQCRGDRLDPRSDVYSLGATYYALLTGRPPFSADVPLQVMFAHVARPVPDPAESAPDLPADCGRIVRRATAKEPMDRYQSADDLLAALDGLLATPDGPPATSPAVRRRRPSSAAWAGLGAVGVAAAIGLWAYFDGRRNEPPAAQPNGLRPKLEDAKPKNVVPATAAAVPQELLDRIPAAGLRLELEGRVSAVAFSPDGKWFAAAGSGPGAGTSVWNNTGQLVARIPTRDGTRVLSISHDGRLIAGDLSGRVRVWALPSGEQEEAIPAFPTANISTVAFHPDGRRIAVGAIPWEGNADSVKMNLKLVARGGAAPRDLLGHEGGIWSLAFSPDGSRLASTARDGTVRVWNVDSGAAEHVLPVGRNPQGYSPSVGYLPDGTLVVGATARVQFYEPDGKKVGEDWNIRHEITALACSSTGLTAVFTSDMRARLWSTAERRQIRNFVVDGDMGGAAFSPDGKLLLAGSSHSAAFLWDVRRIRETP